MAKKTAFMQWIDGQLRSDPALARKVDVFVNEMKIEQELVALREKRGLSQRALAQILGTSQPYVAKLESGKIKNLGVKTLVKAATALGGRLTLKIEPGALVARRAHVGRPAAARAVRRAK
jgi:transcriptional regulator with XRE-family HTH domain